MKISLYTVISGVQIEVEGERDKKLGQRQRDKKTEIKTEQRIPYTFDNAPKA